MPIKHFTFILALCMSLLFSSITSYAAEAAAVHAVDISTAIAQIVTLVFAAITAVGTYFAGKALAVFQVKTGIEVDESTRNYLLTAVESGLKLAERQVKSRAVNIEPIELESEIIAKTLQYLNDMVPDALAYFDMDENKVKSLIASRLSEKNAAQ